MIRAILSGLAEIVALTLFVAAIIMWSSSPGHAATLQRAAVDAEVAGVLGVIVFLVGLWIGHTMGWLQYGRRMKIVAPHDEERDGAFDYRNAAQ